MSYKLIGLLIALLSGCDDDSTSSVPSHAIENCSAGQLTSIIGTDCSPFGNGTYKCAKQQEGQLNDNEAGTQGKVPCGKDTPITECAYCQQGAVFGGDCDGLGHNMFKCSGGLYIDPPVGELSTPHVCETIICEKNSVPENLVQDKAVKDCWACETAYVSSAVCIEKKGQRPSLVGDSILNRWECDNPTQDNIDTAVCVCSAIVCRDDIVTSSIHDCKCEPDRFGCTRSEERYC
jgi:hypothetical protein